MNEKFQYIYEHLVSVFPDKPWVKAYKNLSNGGKEISLQKLSENMLVYGLSLWELSGRKFNSYELGAIEEAMSTCNFFLGTYHSLEEKYKKNVHSRFEAAFTKSNDMRAINFELFMYYYLREIGYSVEDMDGKNIEENYDFLITNENGCQLQLECKSFAYEKGLYLNNDDAYELHKVVCDKINNLTYEGSNRVTVYTIEMYSGMPKSNSGKEQLLQGIICSLENPDEFKNEKFQIHIDVFDDVEDIYKIDSHLNLKVESYGIEVGRFASMPNGNKSRTCVRVTTHLKPSFTREFESVCKKAAKMQLPSDKASYIALHISNHEVLNYIKSDVRFDNKIKNIFNQKHLVGLGLFSNIHCNMSEDQRLFYSSPIIEELKNADTSFNELSGLK
ncbi:hypothetical protein [Aliivibrio fischeri]|uniref:hypothetical protein n=1 Tax=Aliivibrio fischeri TaxID=668 RepID=UPI0007C4F273|nr:hypothetical protein [Aliivibrio fischeri]